MIVRHLVHHLAMLAVLVPAAVSAERAPAQLETVTVTAERETRALEETPHSIAVIGTEDIDRTGATHPAEVFATSTGTWISRGSGQEHLTAIRSPVLTGAGACGAFLFLEDGIPVRPAGFCNVNQLFEINTEMADAIEVLRGPGSVLYGSNALHGVVNVLHTPLRLPLNEVGFTFGEFDRYRMIADHSDLTQYGSRRFKYLGETSGDFQENAGFDQHKLNLAWHGPLWGTQLAVSSLDQDTAGFITGEDAYRDSELRRRNPNPEAFRMAESARFGAILERALFDDVEMTLRPYLRWSEMEFLQHFLPGQPLEENGHTSAGIIASVIGGAGDLQWHGGVDVEWARGWLRETQASSIDDASEFLRETRPAGKHYDYVVAQWSASPWISAEYMLSDATSVTAGMRGDWIRYDYDNRMLDGNTRDDGTACALGGCLFNRPADRNDSFSFVSPKFGVRHHLDDRHVIYGNLLRGFRVPQATELYRLQRGQDVADLDPEYLDSIETGFRGRYSKLDFDLALFSMLKRNVIFRDAEGFNASGGRTRHYGLEFDLAWIVSSEWTLRLNASRASHEYAFDYRPASGEQFIDGNTIDTAPRNLAAINVQWQPLETLMIETGYQYLGSYWLDAENRERYPGHGLMHFRAGLTFDEWALRLRISNLLDTAYAERADYAFGEHRYFPGWPRRAAIEIAYRF